jgi:hypothetical protein
VLVILGLWTFSHLIAGLIAGLIKVLVALVHNTMTFTGDIGAVTMWLWLAIPDAPVAAVAAIGLVWVMESKRPLAWVGTLALFYLYGGFLSAWRLLTHGWRTAPRTPDYVGMGQATIAALACLAVGIWWPRRSSGPKLAAT